MKREKLEQLAADLDERASMAEWLSVDFSNSPALRAIRSRARRLGAVLSYYSIGRLAVPVLVLGLGAFAFGHADTRNTIIASASAPVGLVVSNLIVDGGHHLQVDQVKAELAPVLGKSLLSLNVNMVTEKLLENRWVKSASVRKSYPDTLVVTLKERKPVALWKSEGRLYLISKDGMAIDEASQTHAGLPQVVGRGANQKAADFLSTISLYPELVSRAQAYVRVADRRWDLVLGDDLIVQLPAEGWKDALGQLKQLQVENQILDREIVKLDMRMPDRLVMKLTPQLATHRKAALKKILAESGENT